MNFSIMDAMTLIILSTATTLIFVQIFKVLLNGIILGKLDIKTFLSYGDFPSSHTATLVTFNIVYWYSVYQYHMHHVSVDLFALCLTGLVLLLWSCYEIRDAMGVRLRVQEQAYAIKQIAESSIELSEKIEKLCIEEKRPNTDALQEELDELLVNLKLRAGHLPIEVFGGVITGMLTGGMFVATHSNNLGLMVLFGGLFLLYVIATLVIFYRKRVKINKKRNSY